MTCRICGNSVEELLDLGDSPPANSLLDSPGSQTGFPLVMELCSNCNNIQLKHCILEEDLYKNYFYSTPNSLMLLEHYKVLEKYLFSSRGIDKNSFVFEVGSNNGLFLKFMEPKVGRVLGMDPAKNITKIANDSGIETICDFFNEKSALEIKKDGCPDLIIARHCFAHNKDPHSLMRAVKSILSDEGLTIIENAYVKPTIENNEFDQVYHEHMFYFSIRSMSKLLELNQLKLTDILISPVHGTSIVFVIRHINHPEKVSSRIAEYLDKEIHSLTKKKYLNFKENVFKNCKQLQEKIEILITQGKSIHTYGATAKGNTLLNFIGAKKYFIPYCVDSTKIKQGKYLPGSGIKIISELEALAKSPPDYYLLTAWNFKDEIIEKVRSAGNHHSRFIVPFPFVHVV